MDFTREDVFDLIRQIGGRYTQKGEEVEFEICPFCHGGNRQSDRKTFSINVERNGAYNCKRGKCGARGNAYDLAEKLGLSMHKQYELYSRKKQYRELPQPQTPIRPKDAVVEYFKKRGISKATVERYEIATRKDDSDAMVFPFYDGDGKLVFIKYRRMHFDKSKHKSKEWREKETMPILFGMKQCNPDNKQLVITEGQMDSMALSDAGIENAVSVPSGKNDFSWIPLCWDWLKWFNTITVFGDLENGEMSLLEEVNRRLTFATVKRVRDEDYRGCKDANDVLMRYGKDALVDAVRNATVVPSKSLTNITDIKRENPYESEKMRTGIVAVDRLLYGGLPFGLVHIVGGKRGDGKSCLCSQIIVNAVDQGYTTMVYSGELTQGMVRSWIDYQVAGRNNIVEGKRIDLSPNWIITNQTQAEIDRWYDSKIYVYTRNDVGNENEGLEKTVVDAIKRLGVRVILIDNLMIALSLDEDKRASKIERQERLVMRYAAIAKEYNVMIVLVAHRRKSNGEGTGDVNDEISGASEITNLAGVTFSYDRLTEKDVKDGVGTEEDRKLVVAKNRVFGNINLKGVVVHYDPVSKRIYGDDDDVNKAYIGAANDDGFEFSEESPFT